MSWPLGPRVDDHTHTRADHATSNDGTPIAQAAVMLMFSRKRYVSLAAACIATLSVAACKTSTSGDAASTSANARADFITQYCELIAPCCTVAGSDGSGCNADNAVIGQVVPTAFDSAAGDACLKALHARSSAPDFCAIDAFLSINGECRSLETRQTTPVGGSCSNATTGTECAASPDGQTSCVFGSGKQICQVQVLAAQGDACDADSLDDGAIPFGASLDGPVNEKGAYCDRSKGLFCNNGTCAAAGQLGAACSQDSVDSCAVGLGCAKSTSTCATLVASGAACSGDVGCAVETCENGTCGYFPFTLSSLQNLCNK